MKELLEYMKFTKKSILPISVILLTAMGLISINVGFKSKADKILSITLISVLLIFNILYIFAVLQSYIKLPKNKTGKMGILFYINTHNNSFDYKKIVDKFCEKFEDLSESIEQNKLKLIILTEKQVSSIKNISSRDTQHELLKKTYCDFGVFMKLSDLGDNSDEYELQMNSMLSHPYIAPALKIVLEQSFSRVFSGLHISTLNRKNDLKDLQNLSTQLYYICQFIYGVANEYSGFYLGALNLFKGIIASINNNQTKFYALLNSFVHYELCTTSMSICRIEYLNYINENKYNVLLVQNTLSTMHNSLRNIKNPEFEINYHLAKSVMLFIDGKILESKGEISLLTKKYSSVAPNLRPWIYSDAFLTAYENNPKTYWQINKKYKTLRNNKTQDSFLMFRFINSSLNNNPDNLGLKIALLFIVYYRQDLSVNLLPDNFKNMVVENLYLLKQDDLALYINNLEKEAA